LILLNERLKTNHGYICLIASQIVSNLGDWLDFLALISLLGLQWRVTPLQMMICMMSMTIPAIILGPFFGVLVDRLDRKQCMIYSDLIRAIIIIGIIFSTQLWNLYVLLFFKSTFSAIFFAAKNGKLKEVVSDTDMSQAITVSSMIENFTKIIGPFISGIILVYLGTLAAFYVDAISFLLSALLLLAVPKSNRQHNFDHKETIPSFLCQFKDGVLYISNSKLLLFGCLTISFVMFIMQIIDTQLVIFLRDITNLPSDLIGNCMGASGVGMLVMSWYLNVQSSDINQRISLLQGTIILAVSILALVEIRAISTNLWLLYLFPFFLAGLAMTQIIVPFQIVLQKETPNILIGRVNTTFNSTISLASTMGIFLGGVFVNQFGSYIIFLLAGYSLLVFGLIIYIITRNSSQG